MGLVIVFLSNILAVHFVLVYFNSYGDWEEIYELLLAYSLFTCYWTAWYSNPSNALKPSHLDAWACLFMNKSSCWWAVEIGGKNLLVVILISCTIPFAKSNHLLLILGNLKRYFRRRCESIVSDVLCGWNRRKWES